MSALRSKGQKQKEAIKDPNDSEEPIIKKVESETAVLEMKQMFTEFMRANHENQLQTRFEIEELKKSISSINKPTTPRSEKVPFFDEPSDNRKSSIFFGSPLQSEAENNSRQIQVLQSDIIYEKELKVSSLEGLQYLSKQLQILASKYPGRHIKTAHMVSYNLRPHILAAWNSHCYKESLITGADLDEILVEDWLSLSNANVQKILVEAARPRTRELYSRELILFLGKGIPQSPPINTDNFSKDFYAPLMKSLTDLVNLYELLSAETSNLSNNKSKIPVPGYGTKDSPGQISLWLISLGSQKDSVLQWLGKDELMKHKTLEPAIKFIRTRMMEGRAQSEARHDFDAKLTPIRYEDLRHTQGESNTRQQLNFSNRQHYGTPDQSKFRDNRPKTTYAALESHTIIPNTDCSNDDINQELFQNEPQSHEDEVDDQYEENDNESRYQDASEFNEELHLAALGDPANPRNAILATFRGYCSELFVYGKCSRKDSGCPLDHTSSGQERCIQSFALLTKRELSQHCLLPPWSSQKSDSTKQNSGSRHQDTKHFANRSSEAIHSRLYGVTTSNQK